jgi:uncharacterized RDD family membrane protein YckC
VGSRFLSILLDTLFKSGAILIVWGTLHIVGISLNMNVFSEKLQYLKSSLTLTILLLGALAGFITIGYYVFFEALWNGQTPGKKIVGLRVIKDNGAAITIFDSTVRNFLRVIDFMPSFYLLGTISILYHKKNKRIGDMASGTMVVKIPTETPPAVIPEIEVESPAHLPPLEKLEEKDYHLARSFIIRRGGLESRTRERLAKMVADLMLTRWESAENPFSHDEELLEWIVVQYPLNSRK